MDNTLSLCMIVKNEEKFLSRCLTSVKNIVEEMIIIDTGSTDNTVDIAKSFGAKVYFYKWNNSFSDARNESLKYATKDWILIMDGDDEFCSEDIDKFKALLHSPLDENAIYFFETLNYCGYTIDDNNISVNLNPRLFKNNHGFQYEGRVHNQLVNTKYNVQDISHPIRIYHYGYLQDVMNSKDKRSRNIPLLEEQLKQDPKNKYAYFNLGNEYYSSDNLEKALEHYYKAYEDFNPYTGYGFILITRIVITNYALGQYDKGLEFADIGIKYFPKYTDLYFLKAMIYNQCNQPTLEIKALEKCIELGDPPSDLKFLYGTGSYKAFYSLGNAYMKLKDYDTAYNYYVDTIRSKRDYVVPVYNIGHILKKKNTPLEELKSTLESFFADYPKAYQILADICYIEGHYAAALDYINRSEKEGLFNENLKILKCKTLIRTGSFNECTSINFLSIESPFYFNLLMYKILSGLLTNRQDYSQSVINSIHEKTLSDYSKKMLGVYKQFTKLYNDESGDILSEDENEKEYTAIIFEICEILLVNKFFDIFERALGLLNLISDKSVLLELGKLYHKYGYIDLAKKEIVRSIKLFEVFDAEGLDILRW